MGKELHDAYPSVREIFDAVCDITRMDIRKLCFEGPMETLTETVNLQPAMTAVNLGYLSALTDGGAAPTISAGHSLGEYAALCATGVLSVPDALTAVFKRGSLMHRESQRRKGAMQAIVGLPMETVSVLVANAAVDGMVSVANHNSETQIVITGEPGPVETAAIAAREKGAKAIPLKVSGAWHSELMRGAEAEFTEFLSELTFNPPQSKVAFNVTAEVESDPKAIRSVMGRQLCSPVRWYDIMIRLMGEGVEVFAEVGPGKVLTGLLKKTLPKDHPYALYNINSVKAVEDFLAEAM
jgi:[acyl-carrier-protein] S-malonyltransferase